MSFDPLWYGWQFDLVVAIPFVLVMGVAVWRCVRAERAYEKGLCDEVTNSGEVECLRARGHAGRHRGVDDRGRDVTWGAMSDYPFSGAA